MTKGMFDIQVGEMENGLWYVRVVVDEETAFSRPGFRTREDAGEFGLQWARENLDDIEIEVDNRDMD
jgi:hypothetical protein